MRREDLVDGMRVRLTEDLDIFGLGLFPKGAVGTLTLATIVGLPEMIGLVKLEDHFAVLDEWDNCLYLLSADGECTPELFEPAIGFI